MTSCFHVYPSLHPFLRPLLIRSDPQCSLPPAGVMLSEYSRWQAWQGTREWTQHNSATWLLSLSHLLFFCSALLLCQFCVNSWWLSLFRIGTPFPIIAFQMLTRENFPGKLNMCHSLPCVTDTVLSNKCNRGCFFLVTITMDSTQECAIWYSSTLIQCPVSLSGQ